MTLKFLESHSAKGNPNNDWTGTYDANIRDYDGWGTCEEFYVPDEWLVTGHQGLRSDLTAYGRGYVGAMEDSVKFGGAFFQHKKNTGAPFNYIHMGFMSCRGVSLLEFQLYGTAGGYPYLFLGNSECGTWDASARQSLGHSWNYYGRSTKAMRYSSTILAWTEIYVGLGLGAGNSFIKVWQKGELVLDLTGLTIEIGSFQWASIWGSIIGDLFIYSSNSPITSAPFGEPYVVPLAPNGAGSNADFTPSAGSNYQNVDEWEQDFETTYNSSDGTSGHRDDFAIETLSGKTASGGAVKALQVRVLCYQTASEQIKVYVDIGGTRYYGAAQTPNATYYKYVTEIWELNPATSSPWTVTEIDSVKVGYEVV